jgi:hypothetical protein
MGNKNYGAGVSGYLDPSERNFETVVFQAGKPVVDSELNLAPEIVEQDARALRLSGWLSPDILRSTANADFLYNAPSANEIWINQLLACLNGWLLDVNKTGMVSRNKITLPAPPSGTGAHRTDLIVLEAWRRLISPSPDNTGKSPAFRIWRNGNVRVYDPLDPNVDLNENFDDDLTDGAVGSETTKRVQIQYRLRVISGVDLMAFPNGLDDPTIAVKSVPTSATAPDGVDVALMSYVNMASAGDPGMWRAGDGTPSNGLGTVDGYIYATPLCAIFRRNLTAFDKNTNHNGGVAFPAASDRPDGLNSDLIVASDIADLRHVPQPNGWDYTEMLEKSVNLLLDNNLCSEWTTTARGGSVWGHTVLYANEIGLSTVNGGDGVTTGDTPGAEFIGEFDSVRREFSDRPVFEVVTVRVACPGVQWVAGTVLTISPSALEIWPYAAIDWQAFAPSQCTWVDVVKARYQGYDLSHRSLAADLSSVTNLGTRPQAAIQVTIGTVNPMITDEDLFLDIMIAYPPGLGVSRTPVADFGLASLVVNNPTQLPATSPVRFSTMEFALDWPHREVSLRYRTQIFGIVLSADQDTNPSDQVYLPERAVNVIAVSVNATPVSHSLSADGRVLTINPAGVSGDVINITYQAIRPLPQNGEQVTVWYNYRAPQTVRDLNLPSSVNLWPRCVSPHLHVLTAGSGSLDEAYPFPVAYAQAGGVKTAAGDSFTGDHELDGRTHITVSDFDADTGWLRIPSFLPMVAPSDGLQFNRPGGSGEVDAESRTYYSTAGSGYQPNAYAQSLSDPKKHKVLLPIIAALRDDSGIGKTGQLVMLLLTRWASFDAVNGVFFDIDPLVNTTTASVYRLRGNLLDRRF